MCGILGVATTHTRPLSVGIQSLDRMRDTMRARGPDGAGLWISPPIALAHRRLAVLDPSESAAQPMRSADDRFAIVYNGELYNDAQVRAELSREGVRFRTESDTETVLAALSCWGPAALPRLRGMFALGFYDAERRSLLLGRDPLGIKPLYWSLLRAGGGEELVFASEPRAILAHPAARARPDMAVVSSYLTTIRTTLGTRTLFDGIRTLRPGQAIAFDFAGDEIVPRPLPVPAEPAPAATPDAPAAVRAAVEESVRLHLRADVPLCGLLSGGLDSSVIALLASRGVSTLHTYCSGAADSTRDEHSDFAFARRAAAHLRTSHTDAPVSRELFAQRWPEMVGAMGLPLSTPNEVAINQVARRLRADGMVVALSGEGADELFAGYEGPMREAAAFEGLLPGTHAEATRTAESRARFQLAANAWIPPDAKAAALNEPLWRGLESDAALHEFYRAEFESCACRDPLAAHLKFHRRINLTGLLQRLDTATMLEGVEGRTPFADRRILALAESLPMADKVRFAPDGSCQTKRALRLAFAGDLPAAIIDRPKASFPLPFQSWVADNAPVLRQSAFARDIFTPAAIESVIAQPEQLWRLAWPMINIAMWGRVWWG